MDNTIRKYNDYKKSNIVIRSICLWDIYAAKLMGLILSQIEEFNRQDNGNFRLILRISDIITLFGSDTHHIYRLLKSASAQICQPICISDDENKAFKFINIFSEINYKNGIFTIDVIEAMFPYIISIKSNYTRFSIDMMMQFTNIYAFRLYELLKSELYLKPKDALSIDIEKNIFELRFLLGTIKVDRNNPLEGYARDQDYEKSFMKLKEKNPKGKSVKRIVNYPEWKNFKQKVLDPAIQEVNEITDINLSYKNSSRTKDGIKKIIFSCSIKSETPTCIEQTAEDCKYENIKQILVNSRIPEIKGISEINFKNVIKASKGNDNKVKNAVKAVEEANNVDNPVALLIYFIKNGVVLKKKKKSTEYSNSREYNFKELEEKLFNRQ